MILHAVVCCLVTMAVAQTPTEELINALNRFDEKRVLQALEQNADINVIMDASLNLTPVGWLTLSTLYGVDSRHLVEELIKRGARLDIEVNNEGESLSLYEFALQCAEALRVNKEIFEQTVAQIEEKDEQTCQKIDQALRLHDDCISYAEYIARLIKNASTN